MSTGFYGFKGKIVNVFVDTLFVPIAIALIVYLAFDAVSVIVFMLVDFIGDLFSKNKTRNY